MRPETEGGNAGGAAVDADELRREYRLRRPVLDRLHEESSWELEGAIRDAGIKLHSFTGRVKSEDSFVEKVERKLYADPWALTDDLVGLRAVCLFRSDLRNLESLVRASFDVISESDTVEGGSPDAFGYMSVHLVVRIHSSRAGPRYEGLKDLAFEIQLRTILMDAWANVSQYLDYKGGQSIPSELRRDFFALSGLFYVADQHFELFFNESLTSRRSAAASITAEPSELDVEINLDTMLAYLANRFPDRKHADPASVSGLVEEMARAGYSTLARLDEAVSRVEDNFLAYERDNPPGVPKSEGEGDDEPSPAPRRFLDVGVVRLSLALADPEYGDTNYNSDGSLDEYRVTTN